MSQHDPHLGTQVPGRVGTLDLLDELTDDDLRALRTRLHEVDYAGVLARAEVVAPRTFDLLRLPLVRWALTRRRDEPSSLLALVFLYATAVPLEEVDAALGSRLRGRLTDAGLLSVSDGMASSPFRLVPFQGVTVLADPPDAGADTVMPPGPTTAELARLLPDRIAGTVVDVGAGPGSLALVAAAQGASGVVATDISERACRVARFNARLNGLELDVRHGDLLHPVGEAERFDILVAQPPYVSQPDMLDHVTFLHGGPQGDELAMRLLEDVGRVLSPGGTGMVLFEAQVEEDGAALPDRVEEAVGRGRLDTAVLTVPASAPDAQAIAYGALTDPGLGPRFAEVAVRYREHLEQVRATGAAHALAFLRRPAYEERPAWSVGLPTRAIPRSWSTLQRYVGALDLAAVDDGALLASRVRPWPGARLVEETPLDADGEATVAVRFPADALATDQVVTDASAALLGMVDARSPVEVLVSAFADACGTTDDKVQPAVLGFVRENLALARLCPA